MVQIFRGDDFRDVNSNQLHKNLARLYPCLTAEEKDDLLQSLITAALRYHSVLPEILEAFAREKDFELLMQSVDTTKEVP